MADNLRTSPLRLNPREHRTVLFLGDLLMGVASVFAAIGTWVQYVQYLVTSEATRIMENALLSGRVIEAARAQMSKTPFKRCLSTRQSIKSLEGLAIGRGVLTKINQRLRGPRSCAHLYELTVEAVRLVGMMQLGAKSGYSGKRAANIQEDELIEKIKPQLKNSCMVFASDD